MQQVKPVDLSGTINMTTDLGIPNLSALTNAAGGGDRGGPAFSPTDLLAGSHKALVWAGGPGQARVALQLDMAETDVVHNGNNIWTWDSGSKKVVHYTIAADTKPTTPAGGDAHAATDPAAAVKTPQQLADEFLGQHQPVDRSVDGRTDLPRRPEGRTSWSWPPRRRVDGRPRRDRG